MLKTLHKISQTENSDRRSAIISYLEKHNIPFRVQKGTVFQKEAENIIISLGICSKRTVFGAHYDSVEGSTGANDNASGVCVLLELAKHLTNAHPSPDIDIVFFDLEETGGIGSTLYIDKIGDENIHAMVNFDICGLGDTILAAPIKNTALPPFYEAFADIQNAEYEYKVIKKLPTGDERVFEENNIPNISVCILPREDVALMETLFDKGDDVTPEDFPSIVETMHNGPRDTIDTVEESAMKKVLEFAKDMASALSYR